MVIRKDMKRSELMSRIRSKDTRPEVAVRRVAHSLGYRYVKHSKGLPGKPDLVFTKKMKVVFVHGCFWHGCKRKGCRKAHVPQSNLSYWQPKLLRNRQRDKDNRAKLRKDGWDVLVVWECETTSRSRLERVLSRFLGPPRTP